MPLDLRSLFLASLDLKDSHRLFHASISKSSQSNYPPYNILKINESLYRITIALAGLSKEEIEVLIEDNVLTIKNLAKENSYDYEFIYKGIATRLFEKKFQIAENVKIKNVTLKSGLLNIDLEKIKTKKKALKINIREDD